MAVSSQFLLLSSSQFSSSVEGFKQEFSQPDVLNVLSAMKNAHESSQAFTNPSDDLKLAVNILNWITEGVDILPQDLRDSLLVPVDKPSGIDLQPCSDLMYCDAEWLHSSESSVAEFKVIHRRIAHDTAFKLGVPSLSNRLAPQETLDFDFEQLGPNEPLTLRLSNILKEYKDDAGIFKELIQNADDAGATEVCLLIDWREGRTSSLLAPDMKECQGPALWAYNNATFSDEDFANIAKLAGRTKEAHLNKIGRFGLGFTSVYHLTDVPSFVSRDYVVIFDPHRHHLGNHIRDPSKPGMKINFRTHPIAERFKDQFQPYEGIFGCNMTGRQSFDGTLFRFPLRTREQAKRSEIKNEPYDKKRIDEALESLKQISGKIMIFLNNVRRIKVFQLSEEAASPGKQTLLFEIDAVVESLGAVTSAQAPSQLLSESSALVTSEKTTEEMESLTSSAIIEVSAKCHLTAFRESQRWLVCSAVGQNESLQFAKTRSGRQLGLMPFASVASKLSSDGTNTPEAVNGEVFCFLPLSIATGLPFHVNGVLSNRRGLWWHNTEALGDRRKRDDDACWNENLIKDAVLEAILAMFHSLTSILPQDFRLRAYYGLWPDVDSTSASSLLMWEELATCFYQAIVDRELPFMSSTQNNWISFSESLLLSPEVKTLPHAQSLTKLSSPNYVEIPEDCCHVINCLRIVDETYLNQNMLSMEQFAERLLITALTYLSPLDREELTGAVLSAVWKRSANSPLGLILKKLEIFPCSPDGKEFRQPCMLIEPDGLVLRLFEPEDKRFPHPESYTVGTSGYVLKQLGMKTTATLDWDDVLERMENVKRLSSFDGMVRRVEAIMELMESLIPCPSDIHKKIKSIEFLPVKKCPEDYPLAHDWYSTTHHAGPLAAPQSGQVFFEEWWKKIGSRAIVLRHKYSDFARTRSALSLLNLGRPPVSMLLDQLNIALTYAKKAEKARLPTGLKKMVFGLYKELGKRLKENRESVSCEWFHDRPWILVDDCFVSASQLAFKWHVGKAPPYLFQVPSDLPVELLVASGVREEFEWDDFSFALVQMGSDTGGRNLSKEEINVACSLMGELACASRKWRQSLRGEQEVPLISEDLHLVPATRLTYADVPWVRDSNDAGKTFVHNEFSVTPGVAIDLGVELVRTRFLDDHSTDFPGDPFGQSEPLTQRLKNIIDAYPWGVQILKELVQNADDANASVLHIVYDKRYHSAVRVFSKEWKDLQGPALLVYNDSPFSKEDLAGIQNLGQGSKRGDPAKTGQYGIGFNAVYHLTDCPSFISDDKIFCVLDPHCRFIPGATAEKPGRSFDVTAEFWKNFQDVSHCYHSTLGDLSLSRGTLFRFPLRSSKQASTSKISEVVVTDHVMNKLLEELSVNAADLLLFLNSVTSIKLSVIDREGRSKELFAVEAAIDAIGMKKRQQLSEKISQSKMIETSRIPIFDVVYKMTLTVTKTNEKQETDKMTKSRRQQWLIYQSIGRGSSASETEFRDVRDYALLPRAGIAARLDEKMKTRKGKAYCFLPLPTVTPLPVHINGHFALDSARRDLFRDGSVKEVRSVDWKQSWNEDLIELALAPAYVAFLLEAKKHVQVAENLELPAEKTLDLLEGQLAWFHSLFPSYSSRESYWDALARQVYMVLLKQNSELLAFVDRPLPSDRPLSSVSPLRSSCENSDQNENENQTETVWEVEKLFPSKPTLSWLPVGRMESCQFPALFWKSFIIEQMLDKLDAFVLKSLLLLLGLPVITTTSNIFSALSQTNASSTEMATPISVYNFLLCFDEPDCPCKLEINRKVEDSLLKTPEYVDLLLKFLFYCSQDDNRLSFEKLEGLPLLLTADGYLKKFSKDAVYFSRFPELLQQRQDLFLHSLVRDSALMSLSSHFNETKAVMKLTPSELLKWIKMSGLFDQSCLGEYIRRTEQNSPCNTWVSVFWNYITTEAVSKTEFGLENEAFKDVMTVFDIWPVIPAKSGEVSFCVPPCLGHSVLHAKASSDLPVQRVLQQIGLPVLEVELVGSKAARALVQMRIAIAEKPNTIVEALKFFFTSQVLYSKDQFDVSAAEEILKYFNMNISRTSPADFAADDIKSLSLFETVAGQCVKISAVTAFTIPEELPSVGSECWMAAAGDRTVFLKRKPDLTGLYDFLGLNNTSMPDLYVRYILPCFVKLTNKDRMGHLLFLIDYYEYTTWKEVVKALKETPCFFQRGKLRSVSNFFDPTVRLFKLMLLEDDFPPDPPKKEDQIEENEYSLSWLQFLTAIGLQAIANSEKLLQFAYSLEQDGRKRSTMSADQFALWEEKSKCLFSHLIDHRFSYQQLTFDRIASVEFLPVAEVRQKLKDLSNPFDDRPLGGNQVTSFKKGVILIDSERLCWTSSSFLPEWEELDHLWDKPRQWLCIKEEPLMKDVLANVKNYTRDAIEGEIMPNKKHDKKLAIEVKSISVSLFEYLKKKLRPPASVPDVSTICQDLRHPRAFFEEVMNRDNPDDIKTAEFLHNLRFIFIPKHEMFATPSQVVRRAARDIEIPPYLFELPYDYGQYSLLLQCLGMDLNARPFHYARVLEAIFHQSGGKKLNPNDKERAKWAIEIFFSLLKENHSAISLRSDSTKSSLLSSLQPLYLLDRKDRMRASRDLVYLDYIQYESHLDKLSYDSYPFLIDLPECHLSPHHEDTIDLLPEELQPKKLSCLAKAKIVQETLEKSSSDRHIKSAENLETILTSRNFVSALRSIYMHENRVEETPPSFNNSLEMLLSNFEVICLKSFSTGLFLFHTEEKVEGTAVTGDVFLDCKSDSSLETASLFVTEAVFEKSKETLLHTKVAECILDLLQGSIRDPKSVLAVVSLLRSHPSSIPQSLTELGIRFMELTSKAKGSTKPRRTAVLPGEEVIPEHLEYLELDPGFKFAPDEWVAYEITDGLFVYARIVNELYTLENLGNESCLKRTRYRIIVGNDEEIEVDSLQLHKFIYQRNDTDGESETRVADDDNYHLQQQLVALGEVETVDPTVPTNRDDERARERSLTLREKIDRVRQLLSEIWSLPKDAAKIAIRRLYLKWHPDKTDDPDAEEVFKFLRGEIERHEQGTDTRWSSFYNTWDNFAWSWSRSSSSDHSRRRRQSYRDPPPRASSYSRRVSVGEMFLDQAKADLLCVKHLYDRPSHSVTGRENYAIVCFLCHEAVEKALKGVLLCRIGMDSGRQRTHRLQALLHASEYVGNEKEEMIRFALMVEESHYIHSRYPDASGSIPASSYTQQQAEVALTGAEGVLGLLSHFNAAC
eukprot:m.305435 g.305435  ORF g.305435 m.305435 type:complete len:3250 (+) comp40861_c0_seq2:3832-13581(+)